MHGSKDSIAVGWDDRLPLRSVEPGVTFPAGVPFDFFMDRLGLAFRAELLAFTEVVAGTRASPCTVADAIEVGLIAEACTLSLHVRDLPLFDYREALRPSTRLGPPEEEEFEEEG